MSELGNIVKKFVKELDLEGERISICTITDVSDRKRIDDSIRDATFTVSPHRS